MARTKSLLDPTLAAEALNAGQEIDGDLPTFTHEVKGITFESPIVLKCAQSGRFNPVAKIEGGKYVEDVTFVGRDKTSKNGFYRIDKAADKANQSAWRAKRAALLAEAEGVVNGDNEEEVVEETPAPKARPRSRKRTQAA
jgi:hypothetical protein